MNNNELAESISSKFRNNRIVFWYDAEQQFTESIDKLKSLLNQSDDSALSPNILNMSEESVLAVKKRIELDQPDDKFLLYFPNAEPEHENDWFLDIRLYGEQFYADHSSMLLREIGITQLALRSHIQKRKAFFASTQRTKALKKWVTDKESEQELDQIMIAVVTKAGTNDVNSILYQLFREYQNNGNNEDESYPTFTQISNFGLEESLWVILRSQFGYESDNPSIPDFLLKLFCTELWSQIEADDRDWLKNNVLSTDSGKAMASVFMTSWRDSNLYSVDFNEISERLSDELEIEKNCNRNRYKPEELLECETFEIIEQLVIKGLIHNLLENRKLSNRSKFKDIISKRLGCHWVRINYSNSKKYRNIYQAIKYAEEIFHLRHKFERGFHFSSVKGMYDAYVDEIYQFDQFYRLFNEHEMAISGKGWDILRKLGDEVEKLYTNWYLIELGAKWDELLTKENFIEKWKFPLFPNQYEFFEKEISTYMQIEKHIKRIFVIVSDALRYEAAKELVEIINSEKRFKAETSTQLGVLPSYTQLGMASLLPHKEMSYGSDSSGKVLIDGESSQGLENRNKILQKKSGMAVSAKDIVKWNNEVGREITKDAKVVYIYHNTIDAIGDKSETEEKTFEACRNAINEIKDFVGRIINRFNGSRVIITSDHGFLFRTNSLDIADKTTLDSRPTGAIEAKKRYIIGKNLPASDTCWKGKTRNTANSSCDTEFLLPKGVQRFHFIGGAKFVHGGAMLQEICIPKIVVKALKKDQAKKNERKPVEVIVKNQQSLKLVNNIDKIYFIQTDPVGEEFIARQLIIYIQDSDGNEVSSRETLIFDSSSKEMDDRFKETSISLKGTNFDREKKYTLILENSKTNTIYYSCPVTIDLAFQDDFF